MKSMQYPSSGPAGRGQVTNRASSGAARVSEPAEGATFDPLIGKRVRTRWPDDNNFYEAVITDYNPVEVCISLFLLITCEIMLVLLPIFIFPDILLGATCTGVRYWYYSGDVGMG